MKDRCWFFHDWGKWEVKKIPGLFRYGAGREPIEVLRDTQERQCARCGLVQRKGLHC